MASLTDDEDERARGDRNERDQRDRERLPLGGGADPAAEDVDLRVAPDLRPDHEQEQGERRHLDAAAGRGAAGADEHEHVLEEQGRRRPSARSRAVLKPAVRGCTPWKKAASSFPGVSSGPSVPGLSPLEAEHGEEADREQQARHEQRELRVQRPARRAAQLAAQLEPDGEAEPAEDDRERDRDRDPAVGDELHRGCRSRARSPRC